MSSKERSNKLIMFEAISASINHVEKTRFNFLISKKNIDAPPTDGYGRVKGWVFPLSFL